jgi:hypothetical protein
MSSLTSVDRSSYDPSRLFVKADFLSNHSSWAISNWDRDLIQSYSYTIFHHYITGVYVFNTLNLS